MYYIRSFVHHKKNICILFYSILTESTPTAASCGSALLYISKNINFNLRNDLKIYKYKEFESVFIEIISRKGKNTIAACIYRHLCVEVTEFNEVFLQIIHEQLSYENKEIIVMGNFNIDILKHDSDCGSATFLDNMYETLLLHYVTLPTRVTPRSQTLIDNIFSNIVEDIILGNNTTIISDHYIQFVLFKNQIKSKTNIRKAQETMSH